MTIISNERIRELATHRARWSISLLMPTHRAGHDRQQDSIRLENLIGQAAQQLKELDASPTDVERILSPLKELPSDDEFWRHRANGLACFSSPDFFRAYRVPMKLEERLLIGARFHFRPLLTLLQADARLYILSLTQESARLFEATQTSIREIALTEVAPLEIDGIERPHQYHSHIAGVSGKGSNGTAIYHGHGGPEDRAKKDALRFFQLVDREVTQNLRGQNAPLVLACVGYLAPLYESANSYRYLIKGKIPGSPDRWEEEELRDLAWKLVEPHFRQHKRDAWEQFQQEVGKDRASADLDTVVLAASDGRVQSLFLARGEERWGHVDKAGRSVYMAENERKGLELLDYATTESIRNGGEVFLFDSLPDTDSPVAATFRY